MLKDEIDLELKILQQETVGSITSQNIGIEKMDTNRVNKAKSQTLTRILELVEKEKNKINYCICPYTITNADICGVCGGKILKSNGG